MTTPLPTVAFLLRWMVTFLGFPIGGGIAYLLFRSINTPLQGLLSGLCAGALIGLAQWLVLRMFMPIGARWVLATALGMATGLGISLLVFGNNLELIPFILRATLTGLAVGIAQWLVLQPLRPIAISWVAIVAVSWMVGWMMTRSVGVDLSFHWAVFGSAGALAATLICGIGLIWLMR